MCRSYPFPSLRKGSLILLLAVLLLNGEVHSAYAVSHDFPSIFRSLDEAVLEGMDAWDIPGVAYAVVSGDQVVHMGCFGFRKKGETEPAWRVDEKTVFQIGSTSKAFTATLLAMLVDEERLAWDDRVEDFLPDFRLKDSFAQKDFRLFDLMAQHSGLGEHSLDGMPVLGYGREAVRKALRFVEPETPFRSAFAYQNSLFLCVASIIERETGRSWEQNLRERIFVPLSMQSAGATFEEFTAVPGRTAWLHRFKRGETEVLPMDWPWQDWVYTMGPAGSIHADIEDFARWLTFFIGKGSVGGRQVLSGEEMAFLMKPQTVMGFNNGDGAAYCQGWVRECYRGIDLVWHNGATLGAHSIIALLPEERAGIVVLTDQVGNSLPEAMMRAFADIWSGRSKQDWVRTLSAGAVEETPTRPAKVRPARAKQAYVGLYESSVYGTVQVVDEGRGLRLDFISPKPQSLGLEPWDGDTFTAMWDIFPEPRVFVTFHPDSAGGIGAVTVEPLDDGSGLGRFDRVE